MSEQGKPELGILCEGCGHTFRAHRHPKTRAWEIIGETECNHAYDILGELGGDFADLLDSDNTETSATETLH